MIKQLILPINQPRCQWTLPPQIHPRLDSSYSPPSPYFPTFYPPLLSLKMKKKKSICFFSLSVQHGFTREKDWRSTLYISSRGFILLGHAFNAVYHSFPTATLPSDRSEALHTHCVLCMWERHKSQWAQIRQLKCLFKKKINNNDDLVICCTFNVRQAPQAGLRVNICNRVGSKFD